MSGSVHECEVCEYGFDMNLPGIATTETPYFTHNPDGSRTRYLCSSVCMSKYLETVEHSQPGNPAEVSY